MMEEWRSIKQAALKGCKSAGQRHSLAMQSRHRQQGSPDNDLKFDTKRWDAKITRSMRCYGRTRAGFEGTLL